MFALQLTGAVEAARGSAEMLRAVSRGPSAMLDLDRMASDLVDEARQNSPEDTGAYKNAWRATVKAAGLGDTLIELKNDDPKALMIEYGTPPHLITPRPERGPRARLYFDGKFAAKVMHPGTRPFAVGQTAANAVMSRLQSYYR